MSVSDKFKRGLNKKVLYGVMTLMLIMLCIVISSFLPFVIDPSQWKTKAFLTKEIIIVIVILAVMGTTSLTASASNMSDARSQIAQAKVRFRSIMDSGIKGRKSAFKQWVKAVLEPADAREKRDRLAAKVGFNNYDSTYLDALMSLDGETLEKLLDGPLALEDGRKFHQLTKKQYRFVLKWLDGDYSIRFVPATYYLTASRVDSQKTRSEKAGNEKSATGILMVSDIMFHAIRSVLSAMIFASLVYETASGAGDAEAVATAWITFASRLTAFGTSLFSGYLLGCKLNDLNADYINLRSDILEEFVADTAFRPKTEAELIDDEIKELDASCQTETKQV
ncbi:hypothetical protein [Paratractidigestivibacter sp.]|uniref:hypothetical protein n=1 Tax=Paratractidigestivibacter sp. TaxID=2847316 RepID=UPI002AC959B2|nr:hypothetical protein [Paratractidigestivibacter sp.]